MIADCFCCWFALVDFQVKTGDNVGRAMRALVLAHKARIASPTNAPA
jgi:hypothetical protein